MAIPSGEIYLLKNVPLTPAYEHTIDFADKDEQRQYFLSFVKHPLTEENYSYIRKEREFIALELPLNSLDDVNYMLFRAADGERLYYAFVTDKTYVNDVTSNIYFTIDVMQTYAFDYKWKASYIKQGHVDRWTAEHKPIYSKTDEGLDYGTEYAVENAYNIEQSEYVRWLLVTFKQYSPIVTEGYAGGSLFSPATSPFTSFLVPLIIKNYSNNTPYRICVHRLQGGTVYPATFDDLIDVMADNSAGNYIQSISLLQYNPFLLTRHITDDLIEMSEPVTVTLDTAVLKGSDKSFLVIKKFADSIIKAGRTLARTPWDTGLEDSLPTAKQWEEIKANPYTTKRDKRFESKLLCYPYRYNLLTDWRNAPAVIKNEYLPTDNIEVKYSYALSYNAPFRYWIKDYKKDLQGRNTCVTQLLALEFPIVSDAYYTYMLENKNTIQANVANSLINVASSTAAGAISGATAGPIGAAVGAGVGLVSGAAGVANNIISENAKQKDLKAVPDTIINSTDSAFNIFDNNINLSFYRMRICCENEEIIAEVFNMYGYKVNRVAVPNLRSRTRFNYIQTIGANIVGSFNQNDILKIKEIYDKGVTIWHYQQGAFNMLDYSYENLERNLL